MLQTDTHFECIVMEKAEHYVLKLGAVMHIMHSDGQFGWGWGRTHHRLVALVAVGLPGIQ